MAKVELGLKRTCLSCGMRFYDFKRSPIICPGCGTEFDPENLLKGRKSRVAPKSAAKAGVSDDADDLDETEFEDENNVKVAVNVKPTVNNFVEATDFFRTPLKTYKNFFHHIGIYAFTNKALVRYVGLKRSSLELERKLEQLRAIENNMSIHVGFINSSPLSVDTKNDLIEVKKIMENNE